MGGLDLRRHVASAEGGVYSRPKPLQGRESPCQASTRHFVADQPGVRATAGRAAAGQPTLARASVTFHTNDDDKDHDTAVGIAVVLRDETIAYIYDEFGHFPDHSDSGPYTLLLVRRLPRHAIRQANVFVWIDPVMGPIGGGGDTWRFNFVLDFLFEDGSHQLCTASR